MTPTPLVHVASPRDSTKGALDARYRSLFVVGRGGMGRVEVALERGANGYERVVALKRLLPEAAREARAREMFLREARLAALLCHPNVVHAFAYGDLRGELFIAMEYVEGQPLSAVAAAHAGGGARLEPELVAFVLAEACEGLHAAHELRDVGGRPLKVVHRDVSPHNVMVAYDGRIKLLDFGVAKLDASSNETRTGEVKGKIAYMSPEQALGETLDHRSDLYSIGAVLFECATGRRMWGAGTDLEVMRRMALDAPPRLDEAAPGVPSRLAELHARLVARDPTARPSTALHVADELRAIAGATDGADLRARMHRAFAAAAAESHAMLTRALLDAAPSDVEELRQSLLPDAAGGLTRTEAAIVRGQPSRGSFAWAGAGVLVGAAVAAGAVLAGTGKGHLAWSGAATHPSPSAEPPFPPASPPPPSPDVAIAASAHADGSSAAASPVPAAVPAGSGAHSQGPALSPAKARVARSPAPRLPDVDPKPF